MKSTNNLRNIVALAMVAALGFGSAAQAAPWTDGHDRGEHEWPQHWLRTMPQNQQHDGRQGQQWQQHPQAQQAYGQQRYAHHPQQSWQDRRHDGGYVYNQTSRYAQQYEPRYQQRYEQRRYDGNRDYSQRYYAPQYSGYGHAPRYWAGGYAPQQYWHSHRYYVNDWRARNLYAPPYGYQWVEADTGELLLVALATGLIANVILSQ